MTDADRVLTIKYLLRAKSFCGLTREAEEIDRLVKALKGKNE